MAEAAAASGAAEREEEGERDWEEAGREEDDSESRDEVKAGVRWCASVENDSEAHIEESDRQVREGDGQRGGKIMSGLGGDEDGEQVASKRSLGGGRLRVTVSWDVA